MLSAQHHDLRSVADAVVKLNLLDRYIEVATLKACVLVAAVLTILFSLLTFVDQLADVGKGHYGLVDALIYVLLTAPSRLLQLTPVSALLGSLLALGAMAGSHELTAMRAAGVSTTRIIGWVFKLGVPIMLLLFAVAEFVIPPAQQLAQTERASRLTSNQAMRSGNGYWASGDHRYLNVRRFEHGNIPTDIDIYRFDGNGELEQFIHADHAEIRQDSTWLLAGVLRKRFDDSHVETEHLASLSWKAFLRPQQVDLLQVPPENMAPIALFEYVRDLKRRHQHAERYEQELWVKLNIPLATAAMILIGIPFVFGSLRTSSTGQRVTLGAAIGVVFSLSEQIADQLGRLLNLNPALVATAPSLFLILLAIYLFRRAPT